LWVKRGADYKRIGRRLRSSVGGEILRGVAGVRAVPLTAFRLISRLFD